MATRRVSASKLVHATMVTMADRTGLRWALRNLGDTVARSDSTVTAVTMVSSSACWKADPSTSNMLGTHSCIAGRSSSPSETRNPMQARSADKRICRSKQITKTSDAHVS